MSKSPLPENQIVDWLLTADPAIQWPVQRDLLGDPKATAQTRRLIAQTGWGADLLARQDPQGTWANALYSPKWTSTTYTLLLLTWLGLPGANTQAQRGVSVLWDQARFFGGGLTLAKRIKEPETCITAMLIQLAAAFGYQEERVDPTVSWLLGQQLADGGWNCETVRVGSQHGSFHTTISALDALFAYQTSGGHRDVEAALENGRCFFLEHQLFCSHRTGEIVDPSFTRFPFPPQWHFDVMRGLEHFRRAGAAHDQRLAPAMAAVRAKRSADGRWPKFANYTGRYWFKMESGRGPSRWSTLRALRVIKWWEAADVGRGPSLTGNARQINGIGRDAAG